MGPLRPGDRYTCAACGNTLTFQYTKRPYRPQNCKHPALRALEGERICSHCYNWDYEVMVRAARYGGVSGRKPLKLKEILKRQIVRTSKVE